jgi:hypothetical protein
MTPFDSFTARYGRGPFTSWDAAWLEGYAAAQADRPVACAYCHAEHHVEDVCADGVQRRPPARAT